MPFSKSTGSHRHVYVVDDDPGLRTALVRGLTRLGFDTHHFASAEQFLDGAFIFRPAVILVDMQMPLINGIELQAHMKAKGWDAPVIFISGESTVPQSVTALKQGALDFLSKPFDFEELVRIISVALRQDARRLQVRTRRDDCLRQLATLKPRELEAFHHLAKGYSYLELMQAMDISMPTAKQYRAAVMRKLKFATLAELIQFHQDLVTD